MQIGMTAMVHLSTNMEVDQINCSLLLFIGEFSVIT